MAHGTWHCPKICFLFLFFCFYFIRVLCRSLFSSLWAFWCTSFYHHLDILCYLPYILKALLIPSHCLLCSAFMSALLLSFVFSSRLVSHIIALVFIPCARFLSPRLCYVLRSLSVSVSLLCLSFVSFFMYDQLHYSITSRRSSHQRHCSPHDTMYVIVSSFRIHIDRKMGPSQLAKLIQRSISLPVRLTSKWILG